MTCAQFVLSLSKDEEKEYNPYLGALLEEGEHMVQIKRLRARTNHGRTVRFSSFGTAVSRLKVFPWLDDRGSLLLETVVASMVFALVGVAVLSGLSITYRTGAMVNVHSTAENVARNQMEFVFSQSYQEPGSTPYPTYSTIPSDYSVATSATDVDPLAPDTEIERVNVAVTYDGQVIVSLSTLRFRD